LALRVQLVVLVSAFVVVTSLVSFLSFIFSAPVPSRFVGQFHTKKYYETAIKSECTVSQGLFSQCLCSLMHRVLLLTWFCKLLTRVVAKFFFYGILNGELIETRLPLFYHNTLKPSELQILIVVRTTISQVHSVCHVSA